MSAPLGYVFWHWPRPGISLRGYERKLETFQRSLKANGPDGLIDALSFRVRALPWAAPHKGSWEDWYLVKDFGTLGGLNAAAVDDANRKAHDDVATEAAGGAGGLYTLRQGKLGLREARFAFWLRKPTRTTYEAFLERLSELAGDRRTDLWQRQLVLGPAPEFCIHSEAILDLPELFRPATVRVNLVGSKGGKP
jgi:hypothetical protein